jgi:hypothetical protein
MAKKPLDRGARKLYPPRFIIEGLTLPGCNGFPLNPVLERMVEG